MIVSLFSLVENSDVNIIFTAPTVICAPFSIETRATPIIHKIAAITLYLSGTFLNTPQDKNGTITQNVADKNAHFPAVEPYSIPKTCR